jgi:hypothetical protein
MHHVVFTVFRTVFASQKGKRERPLSLDPQGMDACDLQGQAAWLRLFRDLKWWGDSGVSMAAH